MLHSMLTGYALPQTSLAIFDREIVFDAECFQTTMNSKDELFSLEVPKRFYVHGWIKKLSKYYPFDTEF